MKKIALWALFILGGITGAHGNESKYLENNRKVKPEPEKYHRIISLAPSITETLFALGLEEQVVGVTRYCDYPPKALTKPKVGGYLDPHLEAIIALRPDLVITFPGHQTFTPRLEQLGISTLQVQHQKLKDILDSIRIIGMATGKEAEAKTLLASLKSRMEAIRTKTAHLPRPRVLVVMGHPVSPLREIFVAGAADPYDEMIRIAGGINAYQGHLIRVPPLSAEGIMHLDPEVIIELISEQTAPQDLDDTALLQDWARLSTVAAVKTGRIHFFADDFDTVPGPRFIRTLEKMARAIHPELQWAKP
ncbi:ABC transporter substrate-binding protein [Nitrosococcus oceani]|uniref:Periplasmic binding protein n=2 Tax=Nitrosococcus oceani TaxID=1229 RepID=Q3JCU3_NITOC|nr:helical backbone metal receptor [Nitrosococcus oceani]KFI20330.1 ABC transporter substrate-binding protein [Nitrosococcus oceani C-27]ABA57353.1 Periplasmic binding protein [Nitrosococcus oceani ATCC 19707]EDZ67777.1 Periplasmic binding protein [Nitrosococcus oceani AFC27]KFI23431.1 ABC transporter substrate-binding protein [Nitrosococcus oceani]GEM20229.1 ABC transporter substrate-binding protein [Nitrosococcus oceani]